MKTINVITQNVGIDYQEMPRERLFRLGVSSLSDVELLAILLKTGIKDCSVLEFSKQVLQERQGIIGLLNSQIKDLEGIKGLGKAKIAEIMVIIELCRRYVAENIQRSDWQFCSIDDLRQFLMVHYKGLKTEEVGVLLLDQQHYYIHYQQLNCGSAHTVDLPWRELTRLILNYEAAAVILMHNHPAGHAEASQADIRITEQVESFLAHLDVRLLDHLIIAHDQIISIKA